MSTTIETASGEPSAAEAPETPRAIALVVIWCADEPARVGQCLLVPDDATSVVFGRGSPADDDDTPRAELVAQRPGVNEPTPPLENPFLSRRQFLLSPDEDGVRVEAVGKRPLLVGDRAIERELLRPGDVLEVKNLLLFYCTERPLIMPPLASGSMTSAFGQPDRWGMVGESPAAWELRDRIAFFAPRDAHVLISGDSGTGKELVARALHGQSQRAARPLVARNAATLPSGLVDAELFGNLANYPNPGMPERPGLIGETDGSSLFLDEIGELPQELQTHLLRVLDKGGDYQRLGEAKRRTSNFRLLAATNRPVEQLKYDLAARLGARIRVPGLDERREDIPRIMRAVLRQLAAKDQLLLSRFFARATSDPEPRVSRDLVRALTVHAYTTHVRELESILWTALATSRGGFVDFTDEVRARVSPPRPPIARSKTEISADEIRNALSRNAGIKDKAWRELGLPSRFALHRLIKKYGISG